MMETVEIDSVASYIEVLSEEIDSLTGFLRARKEKINSLESHIKGLSSEKKIPPLSSSREVLSIC